jgi:hypothetical protein
MSEVPYFSTKKSHANSQKSEVDGWKITALSSLMACPKL